MEKFTLNREEAVLLVIDIQDNLAKAMKDKDRVIKNTEILATAAKDMDIPVIITEQYPKGLGNTVSEIKDILKDADVFEKTMFCGLTEEVSKKLESIDRKKIIVVGMETHVCVLQTTRALIEDGYEVHVVRDAVASRTEENYSNGLDMIKDMGASITNTETVIFDLLKSSKAVEFKKLSKLIK